VRNAITAIHNLQALLSSPRVGAKVLTTVLHEFVASVEVLRQAFLGGPPAEDEGAAKARSSLGEFARERLDELRVAIEGAMATNVDARSRLGLEQIVRRVSGELHAAVDLLDLVDRADHGVEVELALGELARAIVRGDAQGSEGEVPVRISVSQGDSILRADARLFKQLLVHAVARLRAAGAGDVTLHARSEGGRAILELGYTPQAAPAGAASAAPPVPIRLPRRIAPTDAIVEAAARRAAIDTAVSGPAEAPSSIALSVPLLSSP
jgi:hypothetical protein